MENARERRPSKQLIQYVTPEGDKFWIEADIKYKVGLVIPDSSDGAKDVIPVLHYNCSYTVIPSSGTINTDIFLPSRCALWNTSMSNVAFQCQKQLQKIMTKTRTVTLPNIPNSSVTSTKSQKKFNSKNSAQQRFSSSQTQSFTTLKSQKFQQKCISTKACETTGFSSRADQSSYSKSFAKSNGENGPAGYPIYKSQNIATKRILTMAEDGSLEILTPEQSQSNVKKRKLQISDDGSLKITTEEQPQNNSEKKNLTMVERCISEFSPPDQEINNIEKRTLALGEDSSIEYSPSDRPQEKAKCGILRTAENDTSEVSTPDQTKSNREKKELTIVESGCSKFKVPHLPQSSNTEIISMMTGNGSGKSCSSALNKRKISTTVEYDLPAHFTHDLAQSSDEDNILRMTNENSPLDELKRNKEIEIAKMIEDGLPDISVSNKPKKNSKRKFRMLTKEGSPECCVTDQLPRKNGSILTIGADMPPKLFIPPYSAAPGTLVLNENRSAITIPADDAPGTVNGDKTENTKISISSALYSLDSDAPQSSSSSSPNDTLSSILKEYPVISIEYDSSLASKLSDAPQIRIPSPFSRLIEELQMIPSTGINTVASSSVSAEIPMCSTMTPEAATADIFNEPYASKPSPELLNIFNKDRHESVKERVKYDSPFSTQLTDTTQSRIPSSSSAAVDDDLYNILEEFLTDYFAIFNRAKSPISTETLITPTKPEEAAPQASKSSNISQDVHDSIHTCTTNSLFSPSSDNSRNRTPSPFSAIAEDTVSAILEEFEPISFSFFYTPSSPLAISPSTTEGDMYMSQTSKISTELLSLCNESTQPSHKFAITTEQKASLPQVLENPPSLPLVP